MISHRYTCIYIQVPKCASTTVLNWFLTHGAGRHAFPPFWYPGPLADRIQSLARALELWPDYFTFTFVRNPYRRFVSMWLHANRHAAERATRIPDQPADYGTLREFGELCRDLLSDTRGLWGGEAVAFLRGNPDRRYGPRGIRLRHLRFVVNHARPQVDFLPDCNPERLFGLPRAHGVPLSFVGAVETLETDFARLQEILGLPVLPLPRCNVSAPAPEALDTLRRDAAMRRLVEELYAEDLVFTGCGLDDAPPPPRLLSTPPAPPPPPLPATRPRPSPSTRLRRARFALASIEIALEARIVGAPRLRRILAPLARLRCSLLRMEGP